MSFVFPSWSTAFSPSFYEDAKGMLETALNKGNKPPVIQGRIEVVDLNMGTQPPTLTLLEIGDLSLERFRGILRLGYQGDAWIEVRCRVQANPLSHNRNLVPSSTLPISTPLLASQPLLVPMTLRLSLLHLRAILILVVSASKGITLVFKNDPLQNVDVSSTFDSVEVIRGYLQQEIEGQLREMFREDLPGIIHRLSQRWLTGSGTGGRVETPYRDGGGGDPNAYPASTEASSVHEDDEDEEYDPASAPVDVFGPHAPAQNGVHSTPRKRTHHRAPGRDRRPSTSALSESPTSYTVFPDIENYDPTYGLRPEGVPSHSGYEAFGRLWEKAREGGGRGLGSLMNGSVGVGGGGGGGLFTGGGAGRGEIDDVIDEEGDEWGEGETNDDIYDDDDDDGTHSFDLVEMDESLRSIGESRRASTIGDHHHRHLDHHHGHHAHSLSVEWETFPAVGGGVVTRPRVYHAQSRIRAPSESGGGGSGGAMPSPAGTAGTAGTATGGSVTARASSVGGASSTISNRGRPQTPLGGLQGLSPYKTASPGPSSLRRIPTSRSDVLLSSHLPRSESLAAIAMQHSHALAHPHQHQPQARATPLRRHPPSSARSPSWDAKAGIGHGYAYAPHKHSEPPQPPQLQRTQSRPMSMDAGARARPVPRAAVNTSGSGRRERATSFGTNAGTVAGTSFPPRTLGPGGITLPLNNSVSQLATLSLSANTLSPYARGHEHIAVRSFPHLGRGGAHVGAGAQGSGPNSSSSGSIYGAAMGSGGMGGVGGGGGATDGAHVKARRKRIFRIGGNNGKGTKREPLLSPDIDDTPSLEWDNETGRASSSTGSAWRANSAAAAAVGLSGGHVGVGVGVGARAPLPAPSLVRAASRTSYPFPKIPE